MKIIPLEIIISEKTGDIFLEYEDKRSENVSAQLRGEKLYLETFNENNGEYEYSEEISVHDFIVRVANYFCLHEHL